jgi:DTW domain-containing protein YfiP
MPKVKLPPGPPSEYRLRHSPHRENLSTFEAISRAMGILEGKAVQRTLEELFLKKVERTLWSRGQLAREKCLTGIPEAAYEFARLAGIAGGALARSKRLSN